MDGGVQPVRSDQEIGFSLPPALKPQSGARRGQVVSDGPRAGLNDHPDFAGGGQKNGVKIGAVNVNVRRAIAPFAGSGQWRRHVGLARPIVANHGVFRLKPRGLDLGLDPQRAQDQHGVGAELNAGADLLQRRRLLEDAHLSADGRQRQRRGKPANPPSGDVCGDWHGCGAQSFRMVPAAGLEPARPRAEGF